MPSRMPSVKMHLSAAAAALHAESLGRELSPSVVKMAVLVDEAMREAERLDVVDLRGTPPEDWATH